MSNSKCKELASILLNHSVKLKKDEKILIEMLGTDCVPLASELIRQAKDIGAIPLFNIIDYKVHILGNGTDLTFSVKGIPAEKYYGTFNIPDGNPYVTNTIGDTLFDEKVAGSFHFTPETALDESDNGNRSNIHWDIVCIQTPEFGGGEIYFDDVLVRKDGKFVLEELKGLNPENLI